MRSESYRREMRKRPRWKPQAPHLSSSAFCSLASPSNSPPLQKHALRYGTHIFHHPTRDTLPPTQNNDQAERRHLLSSTNAFLYPNPFYSAHDLDSPMDCLFGWYGKAPIDPILKLPEQGRRVTLALPHLSAIALCPKRHVVN